MLKKILYYIIVIIFVAVLYLIATSAPYTSPINKNAANISVIQHLTKRIIAFKAFNNENFPSGFDSLIQVNSASGLSEPKYIEIGEASKFLSINSLTIEQFGQLAKSGIDSLMYVSEDQTSILNKKCQRGTIDKLISESNNTITPYSIFLMPNNKNLKKYPMGSKRKGYEYKSGCGIKVTFNDNKTEKNLFDDKIIITTGAIDANAISIVSTTKKLPVMMWKVKTKYIFEACNGEYIRPFKFDETVAYIALGVSDSSTLFNTDLLSGMSNIYKDLVVKRNSYNRFIAIFSIGKYRGDKIVMSNNIEFMTIISASGKTQHNEMCEALINN